MANDQSKIILLSHNVPFNQWKSSLQAKLARRNVLGHVFHDIPGIRPLLMPVDPIVACPDYENSSTLSSEYLIKLEQWILGEIKAKSIITTRLSSIVCPQNYDHMTAKELYDTVAGTRQETATTLYSTALEKFLAVKFLSTTDDYIDQFLSAYQSVNNAADAFSTHAALSKTDYHIGEGLASTIFVMGTRGIEWLDTWRDTRVFAADNQYVSLQSLMSSLRAIAGNRGLQPTAASTTTPSCSNKSKLSPDALCKKCRHRHKNRDCFRLHPELAPEGHKGSKQDKRQKCC